MKRPSFLKFRAIPLCLLLFYSISFSYSGEKQLYFFGGGGEPEGPTTIFDKDINILSRFSNNKSTTWKTNYSFNGGHKKTEAQLRSKLGKANTLGRFDEANFQQAINDLENKLESGKLKSGDQLILIIDTHGTKNSSEEKTHLISLSPSESTKLKTSSEAKKISIDKLEKISNLAAKKGVKLALVDLSCFSGSTLKIANKNV
jgi:hypothetical protein